jgi:hypothetical protein
MPTEFVEADYADSERTLDDTIDELSERRIEGLKNSNGCEFMTNSKSTGRH